MKQSKGRNPVSNTNETKQASKQASKDKSSKAKQRPAKQNKARQSEAKHLASQAKQQRKNKKYPKKLQILYGKAMEAQKGFQDAAGGRQEGLGEPQKPPEKPPSAAREFEEDSKKIPGWPKTALRRPQDSLKTVSSVKENDFSSAWASTCQVCE